MAVDMQDFAYRRQSNYSLEMTRMCTSLTITDAATHLLLGRTMDFPTKTPWQLTYLPIDYHWQPITAPTEFTFQYAVLGGMRATHGHYLIGDGVNSAGLAVAELYFPVEAHYYDQPVSGKLNLSPQDFTSWLLSQNSSVAQIAQRLPEIALIGVPWYDQEAIYPFHWLIADATGTYIIEPTTHSLTITHNPTDVLTNTPNLAKQTANLNRFLHISSSDRRWLTTQLALQAYHGDVPNRAIPTDRFIKATLWRWRDSPDTLVTRSCLTKFLQTMTIPKQNDHHDYTHYYGVLDVDAQAYRFKGIAHPTVTTAKLPELMRRSTNPIILAKE